MFALKVIFVILFISGFIAYIGDNVGKSIGKKRLTIFGLRPKFTAIGITILTGIVIAFLTGTILFVSSADVRTALFGLDKLKSMISERSIELERIKSDKEQLLEEISKIQATLDESKKEIKSLTTTKDSLQKEIKTARSGDLIYKVNDVLSATLIEASSDKTIVKSKLTGFLAEIDNAFVKTFRSKNKHYVLMPTKDMDEAIEFISSHTDKVLVRVVAARNIVAGEVIPVHFQLFENKLIFSKSEIITNTQINGLKPQLEIEQNIKEVLAKVNEIALKKGIIPAPDGSVGNIPYSKIFDMSKTIRNGKKQVTLSIISQKETFASGPLVIDLKINE